VTDYDVWYEGEEVTVERVVANMNKNRENLERLLTRLTETVPDETPCSCQSSLAGAILSDTSAVSAEDINLLAPLVGRYVTS
jgi:5'-methylthioadenosine phosphorylase